MWLHMIILEVYHTPSESKLKSSCTIYYLDVIIEHKMGCTVLCQQSKRIMVCKILKLHYISIRK
jgi:hypothetical protein